MGRVVVVTFDENEEEKLNELLHFLSAKKYSEMPDKQNRVLDYGALPLGFAYCAITVLFSYLYHKFINSFRVFCLCYQLVPQREK